MKLEKKHDGCVIHKMDNKSVILEKVAVVTIHEETMDVLIHETTVTTSEVEHSTCSRSAAENWTVQCDKAANHQDHKMPADFGESRMSLLADMQSTG